MEESTGAFFHFTKPLSDDDKVSQGAFRSATFGIGLIGLQCSIWCATTAAKISPLSLRQTRHRDMPELVKDYLPVAIFMAVAGAIAVGLMASAIIIAVRKPDP